MEEIATQLRELADEIEAEQEADDGLSEVDGHPIAKDLTPENMFGGVYLDKEGDIWIDPEGDDFLCLGVYSEQVAKNIMEALDAE